MVVISFEPGSNTDGDSIQTSGLEPFEIAAYSRQELDHFFPFSFLSLFSTFFRVFE